MEGKDHCSERFSRKEPAVIRRIAKAKDPRAVARKDKQLTIAATRRPSETATRLIELAPDKIDIVFQNRAKRCGSRVAVCAGSVAARKGKSVVRRQQSSSAILTPENWNEAVELVRDLEKYRIGEKRKYPARILSNAPEAWLESILRRDIRRLDANLILSPIYNQFRSSNDKIDLLALRRDGRLVVIELKTQPDREMIFQAADYWRKIELQRRRGVLSAADLFGGREILDKPVLVYLAAPALSFHRDYEFFARSLSPTSSCGGSSCTKNGVRR